MLKFQPKTFYIGKNFEYLTSCQSTNDIAAEKIQKKDFFHGTVIMAEYQSKGRGQRGNDWISSKGDNLLFSLIIQANFLEISEQFYLSKISALAVLKSLKFFDLENVTIKWPNDILINEKKIGGILIENTLLGQKINSSIIGIGINNHQKQFNLPNASSLSIELPTKTFENTEILEKFCEHFEYLLEKLKNKGFDNIQKLYLSHLHGFKIEKKYKDKNGIFNGKIINVDANGYLIIETENGLKTYHLKEIEFIFEK